MIHGIINVYKEKGIHFPRCGGETPRDRRTERRSDTPGHLIRMRQVSFRCVLGKATKLCDLLTDKDKTYEAVYASRHDNGHTGCYRCRILEERSQRRH